MGIQKVIQNIVTEVPKRTRKLIAAQLPAPLEKDTFQRSTASLSETVKKRATKIKTRLFTKTEMLDMKPSELEKIIESRTDIPENLRKWINIPEKLNLYDRVVNLEAVKKLEPEKKELFLNRLFGQYSSQRKEASAQLEILPKLIKKGYDPLMLSDLPICEHNKDFVEAVLKRTDLPEKYAKRYAEIVGGVDKNGGEEFLNKLKEESYGKILRYVDKNNFRYIDECLELTYNFENLPYWKKDTAKILKEFSPGINNNKIYGWPTELLDRLHRNDHSYESVKAIFGDKKMTRVTQRLLEYGKNFDKFKNIGIEDFDKLSVTEKKEFIKGYINTISPKELLYRSQHNLETGFEELPQNMKIYKTLNTETTETLVQSYYDTLRSLLNRLPESERKLISSAIDTKFYRRQYRLDNPIPSLVDELSNVLKIQTRTVNGKTVKYAEMSRDVNFGISAHRFPKGSILTIEALEEVEPNMLLCVGTKGGKRGINVGKDGHALIVKPRQASDWHVQAAYDIDSGNNATKNIYNFEHIMLAGMGNHSNALDLVQNAIKKELNLSQREYTKRMKLLKNCRTLGEIGKIDSDMEQAIRKVIKEERMFEGLMRPESMGVTIPESMPLEEVSEDIINYCIRRDIPLVRVIEK